MPLHQTGGDKVRGQVDTLFKVLDIMNLNTSVQASVLLSQVMNCQQTISGNYAALCGKILDPGLVSHSKNAIQKNCPQLPPRCSKLPDRPFEVWQVGFTELPTISWV